MLKRQRFKVQLLAVGLVAATAIAACGSSGGSAPAADSSAASTGASGGSLSGVCPSTVTLQTDWFPEAEYGVYYSLIGPNGKIDTKKGWYTGPLGNTGINLQIRIGGPFMGQQTVQSLMYQDDSINLGLVHTDDAVRFSKQFPVVGVAAPLEHSPLALLWDPSKHTFTDFKQIGDSGATILVYSKSVNFVPYLIKQGLVPEKSFDDSFDGSYTRFVADSGVVQQAFVTETPYRLEHEIKQFMKPVSTIQVSQMGYDPYLSSLSVRKADLDKMSPCLQKLVPIVQQAQVDYLKSPAVGNDTMIKVTTALKSFWTLSTDLLAFSDQKLAQYKIVDNGPDSTLGNFDTTRVQKIITDFDSTFGKVGTEDPGTTPDTITTNKFIDPGIGL